jgi:hypothetical protein
MAVEIGPRRERIMTMGRSFLDARLERVSWGAILAGAICALALQAMFTLLTLGLGLSLVEDGDASGAGWGGGLFFAFTALVSLFAGGWIAGRLSDAPLTPSAVLHGVVVWAVVTLGAAWLSVSATGALLSGATQAASAVGGAATSVLGGAAQAVGGAVTSLFPELEDVEVEDLRSIVPSSIEQDVAQIMQGRNATPEQIAQEVRAITAQVIDDSELRSARRIIVNAGRRMLRDPINAGSIFDRAVDRLTREGGPLGEQQFDELQGLLQQRYGISEARSAEIAQRWRSEFVEGRNAVIQAYRDTYDAVAQELSEAAAAAADAAQRAARATASASWWTAFGLFVGLLAAAFGAALGRPQDAATVATSNGTID